ncbi:hypothetical protein DYB39_14270 [Providencia rettgeri]|uniref:hypothetical protein n=1 Tax=Providencia rettgeri TaxID=587 RepID=UPI000E3DB0CB|nr:hypothetical protein [Providencia rettgeri]RFT09494.1 hypothetical protein DYB39_14270 [Providencia rettgeri]
MSREDIITRILYSHYLEKLYSTAVGRVDKIISLLIIIFGSSIIFNGSPFVFGVLIVALTGLQTVFQFGKKEGVSRKRAFDYQRLLTNEIKYTDEDLSYHLLELESSDDNIWTSLEEIAAIKTEIKQGAVDYSSLDKLPVKLKLLRLLCG